MPNPPNTYAIYQDGGLYDHVADLAVAIDLAEELLGASTEPSTFSIVDDSNVLRASVTNRRVVGLFHKQQWDHRDNAITVGTEEFDATDRILLMPVTELQAIRDNHESSDDIGRLHVDWDGPRYVDITDSICAYFGVDNLDDITEEALRFARTRANPAGFETTAIEVQGTVHVDVQRGVDRTATLQSLRFRVRSDLSGAVVKSVDLKPVGAKPVAAPPEDQAPTIGISAVAPIACASVERQISVMMQDIVGEYDVPDDVPEWGWVEKNASFAHRQNGRDGIWEFTLNLARDFKDIPPRLSSVMTAARASGISWILFHQGT